MKRLHKEMFYIPSDDLTAKIIYRSRDKKMIDLIKINPSFAQYRNSAKLSKLELKEGKRLLSDTLYGYISRLAFKASKPLCFDIESRISLGMANRLGLEIDQDMEILKTLSQEFKDWLSGCVASVFIADRWKIAIDTDNENNFWVEKISGIYVNSRSA